MWASLKQKTAALSKAVKPVPGKNWDSDEKRLNAENKQFSFFLQRFKASDDRAAMSACKRISGILLATFSATKHKAIKCEKRICGVVNFNVRLTHGSGQFVKLGHEGSKR